jgi:hypothetical protein
VLLEPCSVRLRQASLIIEMSVTRIVIWFVVLGTFCVSAGLLYHAVTNEQSREVKFRPRHLLYRRSINESSRVQLVIEAAICAGLAVAVLVWILL